VNPIDVKSRKGMGQATALKKENPVILGWDISGTVVDVSNEVTEFKKGDEVFGMINRPGSGRAYAQFVAAKADQIALKPANISHEEAAAASLAAMTAYQALVGHASIQPGQKILIHAASGGVGHYAVQIAKNFLKAYVIGTSSAANKDFVLQLGADQHIDYKNRPFEEVSPEVDWILDTIGGNNIERSLKVLKTGGTIISLPSINSADVKEKAAAQGRKGIHFMVRSNGEDMKQIASFLKNGIIKSYISKIFSFDQMKAAHAHVESGNTIGKIVVKI
ncbi:MAG: NADP-dependent oxidoreductase, partial [Chitinophagaceae bacterium]|nr:NADP-dependent oxidoreductase [Chitinophagaceae bacterium]